MKICHFSDWHGSVRVLPAADLYVCTGDMLPNFPILESEDGLRRFDVAAPRHGFPAADGCETCVPSGIVTRRITMPHREMELQQRYIDAVLFGGPHRVGYRGLFGNPAAPVVCVRGNHDFVDLAPAFAGGEVHEIGAPGKIHFVLGLSIAGMRGINYMSGEWMDELDPRTIADRVADLPRSIDVLVTHAPPPHLDSCEGTSFGVDAFVAYVTMRETPLRAHLFGHAHDDGGKQGYCALGILLSNAATTNNMLEL